jgi:hypothetical protein
MSHLSFPTELPLRILAIWAQICPEFKLEDVGTPGGSSRMKHCCFCDSSIKLGVGAADNSLIQHMQSKKCRNAQHTHGNPLPPVESAPVSHGVMSRPPEPDCLKLQSPLASFATKVDPRPATFYDLKEEISASISSSQWVTSIFYEYIF